MTETFIKKIILFKNEDLGETVFVKFVNGTYEEFQNINSLPKIYKKFCDKNPKMISINFKDCIVIWE